MPNCLRVVLLSLVPACLGTTALATLPPQYRLIDLSGDDWQTSFAYAVNDQRMVVGDANFMPGMGSRAFSYLNGVSVNLGALTPESTSASFGLNEAGQIVGRSQNGVLGQLRAFSYDNGVMTNLGSLGGNSVANDVNDAGLIVGNSSQTRLGANRGFIYQDGQMKSLGSLAGGNGGSTANAINNLGHATGGTSIPGGGTHPYVYRDGQMIEIEVESINASGVDINDHGDVAVRLAVDTGGRTYLYSGGALTEVPATLGGERSEPFAMNNSKQIVGRAALPGDSEFRAYLAIDLVMFDLNDLLDESGEGYVVTLATGINDRGWIAANGTLETGGLNKALLLIPIPEPSALALGSIAFLFFRGWAHGRTRLQVHDQHSQAMAAI